MTGEVEPTTPGRITVQKQSGALQDTFRFVAVTNDDSVIVTSAPFHSTMFKASDGRQERQALQAHIAELAVLGWQAIPSGPKWYDHRLYHMGVGKVPMPQLQSQQRGLSAGTMWAWSVAIVLLLFVVCVVLGFSTEIRLTPVAP